MMKMVKLKTIIYSTIALLFVFLFTSSIWISFFGTGYEYGFGDCPYSSDNGTSCTNLGNNYCSTKGTNLVVCDQCNGTGGYETFLSSCGTLIGNQNDTHCYGCTDWGFKTSTRGLILLVLVLALVGFAVTFLPKFRK